MTTAWVPLATTTLSSSAASVTFGSIPSGYRDLIIQGQSSSGTNVNAFIKLNSDGATSNYFAVTMYAEGGTAGSTYNNDGRIMSTGTDEFPFYIQIMDYSASNKHTTVLSRSGAVDIVRAFATRWANTDVVTTVELFHTGGYSFLAGSTFSLYGSNRL